MYSKLFLPILLAASQVQSSPIVPRQDYFTGLVQALNQQGLTTLTSIFTQFAATEQGQQLVTMLPNGNYTAFAPTNAAFEPHLAGIQNDNSSVGPILSYHLINGSYTADVISPPRAHSIAPTFLTNETWVNLGGRPQVQVLEKTPNGTGVLVRRTVGNATVTTSTTYQNLIIHVVDTVLIPPPDLNTTLSANLVGSETNGYSQASAALQKAGLWDQANNGTAQTFFVPIDAAFVAANATISTLTNDQLASVLKNHILFNSLVYSPQLVSTPTAVAASGVQLSFSVQDGVPYVAYNQTRARILRSDVAVKNGVVHVIDHILA